MAGKGAKKRSKAKARAKARNKAQLAPVVIIDPVQLAADERYKELHPRLALMEARFAQQRDQIEREFGHKRGGTPATYASATRSRAGALARLHGTGAITDDQLARAVEIKAEHDRVGADVSIRGANLDTRVDMGVNDGMAFEELGRVHRAQAYTRWRAALPGLLGRRATGAQHLLAMVVEDLGVTWAARNLRMSVRKTREVLCDALDLWSKLLREVRREIDEEDLWRIEARLAR